MLARDDSAARCRSSVPRSMGRAHLREILDMSHGRWLWSGARERWRLRDAETDTP